MYFIKKETTKSANTEILFKVKFGFKEANYGKLNCKTIKVDIINQNVYFIQSNHYFYPATQLHVVHDTLKLYGKYRGHLYKYMGLPRLFCVL